MTPTPPGSSRSAQPPVTPVGPHEQPFVPLDYRAPEQPAPDAARAFYQRMNRRRTVRDFAPTPVSRQTIEWCVRAAGTAPSGAHKQPWRFVCVHDQDTKTRIRHAAEAEEREFYQRRASERWLEDLRPFATDEHKEFLEIAPWLVVVMALKKTDSGSQTYYLNESVGIATGMFLAACHHAGLATLTHTPSPMNFLRTTLNRPEHEKPYLLIPVGYPAEGCLVPKLERKPLEDIAVFIE
ncbi:MAG: nitroreductase family protein [Phycisphaerales bacterium JB040]